MLHKRHEKASASYANAAVAKAPKKKSLRPSPKPIFRSKKKSAKEEPGNPGFNSLAEFYSYLWEKRPHVSFLSGLQIHYPVASVFAHVAPKGRYKALKWLESNIVFLTPYEHHLFDHGTQAQRENYAMEQKKRGHPVCWDDLYRLKEQLITSCQAPIKR